MEKLNKTTIILLILVVVAVGYIVFQRNTHIESVSINKEYTDSLDRANLDLMISNATIFTLNDSLSEVINDQSIIIFADSVALVKSERIINKLKQRKHEVSNYVDGLDNIAVLDKLSKFTY